MTGHALRPYLSADAAILNDIFRDSIDVLTRDDYDEEQRNAWAAGADDEVAFATRLARGLTLVATRDGEPVGFASLADNVRIDLLYVQPDFARSGIGSALVEALERLARARGAGRLEVDASDTARLFFENHGYVAQSRRTVFCNGEWITNTTMTKVLAVATAQAPRQ